MKGFLEGGGVLLHCWKCPIFAHKGAKRMGVLGGRS